MIERRPPSKASLKPKTPRPTFFTAEGGSGGNNAIRITKIADKSMIAGVLFLEKDVANIEKYNKNCPVPHLAVDLGGYVFSGTQYYHDLSNAVREMPEWMPITDEAVNKFSRIKGRQPANYVNIHNTAGHILQADYTARKIKKRFKPRVAIDYIIKPRADNELATEIYEQYLDFEHRYPLYDTRIIAENEFLGDAMKHYDYGNGVGLLGIIENTTESDAQNKFKIFCRNKYYELHSEVFYQPYFPEFTKEPPFLTFRRNYGVDVRLMADTIQEMNSVACSHTTILADIYAEQYQDLQNIQNWNSKKRSYLHHIKGKPKFHGNYFVASMRPIKPRFGNRYGNDFRQYEKKLKELGLI